MKRLIGFDVKNPVDDLWFHMHIIAVGDYFVCKLNGKVANTHLEPRRSFRSKSGHFAFQMHHKGTKVQFKNLEVRELAPDFQPADGAK